jgi:hypothetical protein
MKVTSIAAAGIALVLIALTLTPSVGEYRAYFAIGALVCIGIALATIVAGWHQRPPAPDVPSSTAARSVDDHASPHRVVADAPALRTVAGEAEIVGFLATLQEKGRLVDFLQDDITAYTDSQIGAAARVVHQGCKAVLSEYFHIVPVREESEGSRVTLPAEYPADEYRLVGKISGSAPFTGTLMHRGWKARSVSLPRVLRAADDRLPTIAPAEVELR